MVHLNLQLAFKILIHMRCLELPPDLLGRSGWGNHAAAQGEILGFQLKCQRTRSVAFQNKLAFLSRTGSSVCLGEGRWKMRGRS